MSPLRNTNMHSLVKNVLVDWASLLSLTVISMIILFKKYTIFPQRLIMYLSVAAFFQAIGYVMVNSTKKH